MAKKDFPLDIDLMKNELQNSSFHKLSVPPSSPVIGQFYYDNEDGIPYYWDGLLWKDFGGSTGMVESVTSTDNHIVVDNADPKNPSLSFQLVDNENLLTDDELAVVQSVENGAQVNIIEEVQVNGTALTVTNKSVNVLIPSAPDLSGYLLKDTTLQTAEIPTDTSLFSWWNGTSRVKSTLLAIWNVLKAKADLLYVSVQLRFEKHTGFYSANDPRNKKILVTYNGDKTVTLNRSDGVFQGYFEGVAIAGLTNGYTSPAINETTPIGLWFLYNNGTSTFWSQTPFLFSYCMITIAYFRTDGTFLFVVPETHGFMPESTHEELHKAIGAYGYSGNGVSGYTLNSTTATNRRPTFEAGVIADEDKFTDLALMNSNYTRSWITSGGSITSDWNNTEIIPLNGARPIINVITNGLGSQVDITNNNYCAIFVFKIAVGADSDSQRYRCVILQPQHQGTLTQMQAVNYTSVNINGLTGISNEIIFTQKIIVRYTGNNWTITSIENISGNARFSVISSGTTSGVNELNVTMDARTHLTGLTLDANADIIDSLVTSNVTTSATSGVITLAKQTVTTLTTTLTNAHTLTIIPELPTVFTNRNYSEVVLTVGATAPSITWSAPTDVVFTWTAPLGTPAGGLKINTKHKLFYDWESATSCLISRRQL